MNSNTVQQVYQQEGDPRIYLNASGQWYYYDPNSTPLGNGAMGTVYLGFSCNSNRVTSRRIYKGCSCSNEKPLPLNWEPRKNHDKLP